MLLKLNAYLFIKTKKLTKIFQFIDTLRWLSLIYGRGGDQENIYIYIYIYIYMMKHQNYHHGNPGKHYDCVYIFFYDYIVVNRTEYFHR